MAEAETFGQALKRWRKRQLLTQAALAAAVGTKQAVVGRWEVGLSLPSLTMQRRLIEALQVDREEFVNAVEVAERARAEGKAAV